MQNNFAHLRGRVLFRLSVRLQMRSDVKQENKASVRRFKMSLDKMCFLYLILY